MTHRFDVLIVGAGFTGATIAERLATSGLKVLVIDRRPQIAGNAYDFLNKDGVLCHAYGPHIFHTNSEEVFMYLSMFTEWVAYEHKVLAYVNGTAVPLPFNFASIDSLFGSEADGLKTLLAEFYGIGSNVPIMKLRESPDIRVRRIADFIFSSVFLSYSRKQWGVEPETLSPSVLARVPVRISYDDRYFQDKFQAMPKLGYTKMFEKILKHDNICVKTGTDFKELDDVYKDLYTVFTGPIDEFYDFKLGALPYRSLRFEFESFDKGPYQPVAQVNYPGEEPYTRITEMPLLTQQRCESTVIAREFPIPHIPGATEPYYPVPQEQNLALHRRYLELAETLSPNICFAGRLGDYRYYNMDQAVASALKRARQIIDGKAGGTSRH